MARRIVLSVDDLPDQQAAPVDPLGWGHGVSTTNPAYAFLEGLVQQFIFAVVKDTSNYITKNEEEEHYATLYGKTHGRKPAKPDLHAFMEMEKRTFHPRNLMMREIEHLRSNRERVTVTPQELTMMRSLLSETKDAMWLRKQLNRLCELVADGDISKMIAECVIDRLAKLIVVMPNEVYAKAIQMLNSGEKTEAIPYKSPIGNQKPSRSKELMDIISKAPLPSITKKSIKPSKYDEDMLWRASPPDVSLINTFEAKPSPAFLHPSFTPSTDSRQEQFETLRQLYSSGQINTEQLQEALGIAQFDT